MRRDQRCVDPSDVIYDFHHSLDTLIFTVADRILKLKSMRKAHEYFYLDFVNDVGIINLLRKEYFRSGRIRKVFRLYQDTRRYPESHHYESLFALLVITITGSVISDVVLDLYRDNKKKIWNLVNRSVIDKVLKRKDTDDVVKKFCDVEAESLMLDFVSLKNAYLARLMLEKSMITSTQYYSLVDFFFADRGIPLSKRLLDKHKAFQKDYNKLSDCINEDRIWQITKACARRTVIQYLKQVGKEILLSKDIKNARLFRGLAAAPGVGKGKSLIFARRMNSSRLRTGGYVLCIDSKDYLPEHIFVLRGADGVVTCNCGMTGHIPVQCRGMRKACVVIKVEDFSSLKNEDNIIVSGTDGIVATGVLGGE